MKTNVMGTPGHFAIRDSILTLELFTISPGDFFTMNTIRFEGTVKDDSTILLTKEICRWCIQHVRGYPKSGIKSLNEEYKFYPTSIKPDSSKIWFKNSKWYSKRVWYNQ